MGLRGVSASTVVETQAKRRCLQPRKRWKHAREKGVVSSRDGGGNTQGKRAVLQPGRRWKHTREKGGVLSQYGGGNTQRKRSKRAVLSASTAAKKLPKGGRRRHRVGRADGLLRHDLMPPTASGRPTINQGHHGGRTVHVWKAQSEVIRANTVHTHCRRKGLHRRTCPGQRCTICVDYYVQRTVLRTHVAGAVGCTAHTSWPHTLPAQVGAGPPPHLAGPSAAALFDPVRVAQAGLEGEGLPAYGDGREREKGLCYSADAPSPSLLMHLLHEEGGVQHRRSSSLCGGERERTLSFC